jgi:hypothetical protein
MFQSPNRNMGGARNDSGDIVCTMDSLPGEGENGQIGKGRIMFQGKYIEDSPNPYSS